MGMNQHWERFEAGIYEKDTPIKWCKWWWQRITRGYDDRDVYDLNRAIVRFVYPRLKHFATWQLEHGRIYPDDVDPATWLEILNKIVAAFEVLERTQGDTWEENEESVVWEGLALFGKYLTDLEGY